MHASTIPKVRRAFTECNVDMAGPFSIRHGRSRATVKNYVILIACASAFKRRRTRQEKPLMTPSKDIHAFMVCRKSYTVTMEETL